MKTFVLCVLLVGGVSAVAAPFTLKDKLVEVAVDAKGNLVMLKNLQTGHDYAGGRPLWRLYFDRKNGEHEIEVRGAENTPKIRREGNRIVLQYDSLKVRNSSVKMQLALAVSLENGVARFGSRLSNDEPATIIREWQYPLVGKCQLPEDHRLLTTFRGGQLYSDSQKKIISAANNPPYKAPGQLYRQMGLKYPGSTSANCFALVGTAQGLYFGSHDPTFQDTWHGLRLYPDASGAFTELEFGLYKYPNCVKGQSWACDANVIAPYSGTWHQTSKIYRQ